MSMIPQEIVEKVRQSVDIVDVIGQYVQLKKAGAYHKGLSPFQKEKTPSFMVSPQRQSFKCYSSGHGGDVFKFVMLYENLDFPSAVRKLAEQAGIEVPEERTYGHRAPGDTKASKEILYKLHSQLALHWRDILLKSPTAQTARDYLKKRKIPESWIKDFCLGYAPDSWDATIQWAKKEGFTQAQLHEGGLILIPEEANSRPYDRFRGRLMFPIHDESGRVVGFSGRIMTDDKNAPKYVNSPETIIFKKGKLLFGLDRAKRAILDAEHAIVCEGQIDVLRCHATGALNVIAPLGTAFTQEHCKLLKRFTDRIILCLDADRAGQSSAMRLGEMIAESQDDLRDALVESDFGIQIIQLPEGQDPDSFITQHGSDAFKKILSAPIDFLDFYIAQLRAKEKNDTPAARRRIVEATARLLLHVKNAVVRDHLIHQASGKLALAPHLLADEINRLSHAKRPALYNAEHENGDSQNIKPVEKLVVHPMIKGLILLALSEPSFIPEIQRQLQPEWIQDLAGTELLQKMIHHHTQDDWSTFHELCNHLAAAEQNYVAGLVHEELDAIVDVDMKTRLQDVEKLIRKIEFDYLTKQIQILKQFLNDEKILLSERQKKAKEMPLLISRLNASRKTRAI